MTDTSPIRLPGNNSTNSNRAANPAGVCEYWCSYCDRQPHDWQEHKWQTGGVAVHAFLINFQSAATFAYCGGEAEEHT
jgi:hypothetical protein